MDQMITELSKDMVVLDLAVTKLITGQVDDIGCGWGLHAHDITRRVQQCVT